MGAGLGAAFLPLRCCLFQVAEFLALALLSLGGVMAQFCKKRAIGAEWLPNQIDAAAIVS